MKYLGDPQSGSKNAVTASRNRFGQYYRTRAIPTNPRSSKQTVTRTTFGTLAAMWRDLNDGQRAGWVMCAQENPILNSLGVLVTLTGLQQFVRANTAFLSIGQAVLMTPVMSTTWSDNTIVVTAASATNSVSIAYTAPAAGQFLVFDCGQQTSAGVSYWGDFRFMASVDSTGMTPEVVTVAYHAAFGLLIAGKAIFSRARCLNECGVYGPGLIVKAVVS